MNCDISVAELTRFDADPSFSVTALVQQCRDKVCTLPLGVENPDLSGPGVVFCYFIQLTVALYFGPLLHFIQITRDVLRRRRELKSSQREYEKYGQRSFAVLTVTYEIFFAFQNSASKLHETALTTQLYFSFVLALSCLVRQYTRDVYNTPSVFEGVYIDNLAGANAISLLLTWSTYPARPTRRVFVNIMFAASIAMSSMASMAAIVVPASLTFQRVLGACYKDVPEFTEFDLHSYLSQLVFVIAPAVALIAVSAIRQILSRRYARKARKRIIHGWEGSKNGGYWHGLLITVYYLALLFCVANGVILLIRCEDVRLRMREISFSAGREFGPYEEEEWGIGQISAPFAWAPLLVEGIYAMRGFRKWSCCGKRRRREKPELTLTDPRGRPRRGSHAAWWKSRYGDDGDGELGMGLGLRSNAGSFAVLKSPTRTVSDIELAQLPVPRGYPLPRVETGESLSRSPRSSFGPIGGSSSMVPSPLLLGGIYRRDS